jgi:hypothetical protein
MATAGPFNAYLSQRSNFLPRWFPGTGDQLMRSRRIGSPSRGLGIGHICQRGL